MEPIACLVTDRRRLADASIPGLVHQIRVAATAGVQLVQLRERDLDARALVELTRQAVDAVRGTMTRVIVNDRLDIALTVPAHGVHLRADSFAAARARSIAPLGFLIGRSIHSVDEARGARTAGADYLLFGNVFETSSKPGRPGAGLEALRAVADATPLPVLALGGVTRARVPALLAAGAAGFAAITLFADGIVG